MTADRGTEQKDPSRMAQAMARRVLIENGRGLNEPFNESDEAIPVLAASYDQLLTDSSQALNASVEILRFLCNGHFGSLGLEGAEPDEQAVFVEALVQAVSSNPERGLEITLRERDKALELGAQKGIDPAKIFEDDELYDELIRATLTPAEYVTYQIDELEGFISRAPAAFRDAHFKLFHLDDQDKGPFAEAGRAFANALVPNDWTEEDDKEVAKIIFMIELPSLKVIGDRMRRFWGEDGFMAIPEEYKKKVTAATFFIEAFPQYDALLFD